MNPEDEVLDAIAALVDEQLERGPLDDYDVNRYPDCDFCPHDWHGTACIQAYCDCEGSRSTPAQRREGRDRLGQMMTSLVEMINGIMGAPMVDEAHLLETWFGDLMPELPLEEQFPSPFPRAPARAPEGEGEEEGRAYTLADLEAMRSSRSDAVGSYPYREHFLIPEEQLQLVDLVDAQGNVIARGVPFYFPEDEDDDA